MGNKIENLSKISILNNVWQSALDLQFPLLSIYIFNSNTFSVYVGSSKINNNIN